jgi:UDP-N-acetylmuramoyl-L-alanyl-D-glutamate--2,6-diaminopimelate ligase
MEYSKLAQKVCAAPGISIDSRQVKPRWCFFALPGVSQNGDRFIAQAIANGAQFAVTDNISYSGHENIIIVDNALAALTYCLQRFYPNLPEHKIAITGTNGKTSTAHFCQQIIALLGEKSASIGTIGLLGLQDDSSHIAELAKLTSNDIVSNYQMLSSLKAKGINYVSLEASSIGLDQNRFAGITFSAAAFTNFTQDHLDYHHNMPSYLAAKLKLFNNHMAANSSIFLSQQVALALKGELATGKIIGSDPSCHVIIKSHTANLQSQEIVFSYNNKTYLLQTNLVGSFLGINMLFAVMICHNLGFSLEAILQVSTKLKAAAGRMQKADHPTKYIFIDYAHNPDALERVLLELNTLKAPNAKIITVFGCGGDRDNSKRPLMGQIASRLSHFVLVTDDNPRGEDPGKIRAEIVSKISNPNYKVIANRQKAIENGLSMLDNYDIMLIAGKGHENYQIYNNNKQFFSDLEIVNQNIYK